MLILQVDEGTKMPVSNGRRPSKRFSSMLKIPWMKYSIFLGIISLAVFLTLLYLLRILNVSNAQLFFNAKAFVTDYGLMGIFFATILAGTVVPLGSPALVVTAALFGVSPLPLILTATTGFTIGMAINYGLAYYLGRPYITKKLNAEKFNEVTQLWSRWGWAIYIIFGLVPVFPVELLSFVCGLLKTRLSVFLVLSFVPRLIVFTILAYFGEQVGIWIGII